MSDSKTFWLVLTNIALGVVLVLLVLTLSTGMLCELISKLRKRHAASAELDRDMLQMFGEAPVVKRDHVTPPRA